jgi:transcriptional regulator with XRE-family HTH domain
MHNHLGSRFRDFRQRVGLTQAQISRYLGVDQSYVSKFENGEREFSVDLLIKAAELFGCTLEDLANPNNENLPLPMAMRATEVQDEDLQVIATMNRLALNLRFMESLLKGERQ